jgi:pRiA4b ORF-3-like protein
VDLLGGGGITCDPPPGRIFIVGPSHTFAHFADAIDAAFARWDLSHLHEFELADERLIGFPDDTYEPEVVWHDHAKLKVGRELKPGDEFTYVFDLGDNWRHRCIVEREKADPLEEYGGIPARPVAIWGWGSIPDQYGRQAFEYDEEL